MSKAKIETRLERLATNVSGKLHFILTPPLASQRPLRETRIPAFRHGLVNLPGGETLPCMILNLSGSGARISLDGANNLPLTVQLAIPQHSIKVVADVRWQRGREAGLKFTGKPA